MKRKDLGFALFFTAHGVSATAMAFVLAWVFGGLSGWIAVLSLGFGFIRAQRFVRNIQSTLEWKAPEASRPWSSAELAIGALLLFAAWKHFAWLMPWMPLPGGARLTTLSVTNYGDLSLHLNFIRALANGIDFLPVNPIFAGGVGPALLQEPLRYPFGPDLYNALWEVLGVQTSGHLFVVGVLATFASLVLLREIGGAWAMAAFFLAGGAVAAEGPGALDWKNLFLSVWITQRGFLWALPMGLILLLYLRPHLSGEIRLSRRALGGIGRMWAVYPLFHAHSFVVVSLLIFSLTWMDFGWRRTREFLRRFFIENHALRWALVPASLLIAHTSAGFSKASIVHLRPFWMMPLDEGFEASLQWVARNFGFSILVFLWAGVIIWWARRKIKVRAPSLFREAVLLFAFFLVFGCVMLAPWDWDNVKVLIWPWILLFALLGRSFVRLDEVRPSHFWSILTWCGILLAFQVGLSTLVQSWQRPADRSVTIWTLEELTRAESALKRISPRAIFASAPTPNHVLAYFGRLRAMGYPGHLWSHAIQYDVTERELDRLMTGQGSPEGWVEAAKRLKITHIYWGPDERLKWGEQKNAASTHWLHRLSKVSDVDGHQVYEFKEAL